MSSIRIRQSSCRLQAFWDNTYQFPVTVYLSETTGQTRVCTKFNTFPVATKFKSWTSVSVWKSFKALVLQLPRTPSAMTEPEISRPLSVDSLPVPSLRKDQSEVKGSTSHDALNKESRPEGAVSEANEKAELDKEHDEVSSRYRFLIFFSMSLIISAIIRSRRC